MHDVHLGGIDLNLLVALDALLEDGNVTHAAKRIGISQSAMSHALARLRVITGDALLVRARGGMVPTARALALGPPIRRALEDVARALAPPPVFEPRAAKDRVRLGTSDYVELVVLPSLVALLAREAPGIDLHAHVIGPVSSAPLAGSALDLVIAPRRKEDEAPGVYARALFDEEFVCVVRRGHPLAKKKLTIARFVAADHALISPRGTLGGFVDEALARLGKKRRVAVMVPHFLIAPHIVAASDLILTVARRVADVLAGPLGLAVLAPPPELRLVGFTMSLMWHERTQNAPAHRWIRERIFEVAATLA